MADIHHSPSGTRNRLLVLVLLLVLLYVIVPKLGSFSKSVAVLESANPSFVAYGVAATVLTYFLAAAIYQALVAKRLYYRRTIIVQAATAFADRLLPAGLGSMTLYAAYLKRSGRGIGASIAAVFTNNLLGIVGHATLLLIVLIFGMDAVAVKWHLPSVSAGWAIGVFAVLGVVGFVIASQKIKRSFQSAVRHTIAQLAAYRKRPVAVAAAFVFSLGLTVLYVVVFYSCTRAVGANISPWVAFIVFTVGTAVGAVTPTPGGLVGVEAGLVAGLVAYGLTAPVALAAVLLYRLITYWLPLIPGVIAFLYVSKRYIAPRQKTP